MSQAGRRWSTLAWGWFFGLGSLLFALVRVATGLGPSTLDAVTNALKVSVGAIAVGLLSGFRAPLWVLAGAIFATVLVAISVALEPYVLQLRGHRRLSRRERNRIEPLVEEVAHAMRLPANRRPTLMVAHGKKLVGAWCAPRTVILSEEVGLYEGNENLSRDEICALLAHELHHWRKGDVVADRLVAFAALPVSIPLGLAMGRERLQDQRFLPFRWALWFFLWPALLLGHAVVAVSAPRQRRHEYEADAAAATAGYRDGMRRVLEELKVFEPGRTGWERAVETTHPPIELRLEALEDVSEDVDLDEATPASERREGPALGRLAAVLGAAVVCVAVLLVAKPSIHTGGGTTPAQPSAPTPPTPPAVPGGGGDRSGVPVNYQHTREGAAAAAANDDQALWAAATDPDRADRVLDAIAAPSGRTALKAKTRQGISGLTNVLHGRQATERSRSVAYLVETYSPQQATVDVAGRLTLTIQGVGTRTTCVVDSYQLRWLPDWKVADITMVTDLPPLDPKTCIPTAGFTRITH